MHGIYHEAIAAVGGILFIIIGLTRRRERLHLDPTDKKKESNVLWMTLLIVGVCLFIFAVGLIIYKQNHHPD